MCEACHTWSTALERDLLDTYLYQHFLHLGFTPARGVENTDAPNYAHGVWTCGECFALVQGCRVHDHFAAMHGVHFDVGIWDYIRMRESGKEVAKLEDH